MNGGSIKEKVAPIAHTTSDVFRLGVGVVILSSELYVRTFTEQGPFTKGTRLHDPIMATADRLHSISEFAIHAFETNDTDAGQED